MKLFLDFFISKVVISQQIETIYASPGIKCVFLCGGVNISINTNTDLNIKTSKTTIYPIKKVLLN